MYGFAKLRFTLYTLIALAVAVLALNAISLRAQADPRVMPIVPAANSASAFIANGTVRQDTSADARFNRLLASVHRVGLPTSRPDAGLSAQHFILVDVRPMLLGNNRARLDAALAQRARELTALRSDLQGHFALRDALVAGKVPMSQVIAVDALTSATHATVYYLPPQQR